MVTWMSFQPMACMKTMLVYCFKISGIPLCKCEDYIYESSTVSHYLFFLLFIVLHTPKSCCLIIIDLEIRLAISLIFDVWSTECGISKSWIIYQRTITSIQQICCIIEHGNLYIGRGLWTKLSNPLTFPSITVYASSFLPYFCYVLIWFVLLCSFIYFHQIVGSMWWWSREIWKSICCPVA